MWILIDLDATCKVGSAAGQKVTSTANFPPELARRELAKVEVKQHSDIEMVQASVQFEMFYLGLLIFQLCTLDAETLWKSTQADNMVNWDEDAWTLAYHFEEHKIRVVERILRSDEKHPKTGDLQNWADAADLALWCLQAKASRRPESIKDVLAHALFDPLNGSRRFPVPLKERQHALHQSIAEMNTEAVHAQFDTGGVHYNLALPGSAVLPLHRAIKAGSLEMVQLILSEIHTQAVASVLNMKTEYDFTALHWCAYFGHVEIAELLLDRPLYQQCNTDLLNYRNKTAWGVAETVGSEAMLAVFNHFADSELYANVALPKEKARRARRPVVKDTFRDDIELDMLRFTLWCIVLYDNWKKLAQGAFGVVYRVTGILSIEVNGRRFAEAAVKVPKDRGVDELKSEVEGLGQLSHENIVQILGMIYGVPPKQREPTYMMALEYCDTDLEHVVLKEELYPEYTKETALQLAAGIARGMSYIHSRGILHLDMKLENVLLKRADTVDNTASPMFIPKIADFGMGAVGEDFGMDTVGEEPSKPASSIAPIGDGAKGPSIIKHATWIGTYLYMPPEATGLNAEKGYPKGGIVTEPADPLFGAPDSFSFGVMFLIMMTRDARWFESDGLELPSMTGKDGKLVEDMKTIARWYYHGTRPQFEASFPPLLRLLIEGCWADKQSDRLRFADIEALLTDETLSWLTAPEEPESFDEWLARVGVEDKKEELYEYDVREGQNPLDKLVEMLTDEPDDFDDMLEDLFAGSDEMRAAFRAAAEALSTPCRQAADDSADATKDAQDGLTARQKLLGMLTKTGLEEQLAQVMEVLRAKDKLLEESAAELRLKDAELSLSRQRQREAEAQSSDGSYYR